MCSCKGTCRHCCSLRADSLHDYVIFKRAEGQQWFKPEGPYTRGRNAEDAALKWAEHNNIQTPATILVQSVKCGVIKSITVQPSHRYEVHVNNG